MKISEARNLGLETEKYCLLAGIKTFEEIIDNG